MKKIPSKEEFRIKFIEAQIFEKEKDSAFLCANDLRRKYPEYLGLVNMSEIYRKIVNYRISYYGNSRLVDSV